MFKLFQTHSAEQKLSVALYWAEKINLGWIVGFLSALLVIYFLLLGPEPTVLSLNVLLTHMGHLNHFFQLLLISLMPIYLSVLIFGGSLFGAIVGSYFWEKIKHLAKMIIDRS